MTFGRNIQDSRIEFACFSFYVGLLFYQLFVLQTGRKMKITRILTLYQANAPTLARYNFLKHTPKLI